MPFFQFAVNSWRCLKWVDRYSRLCLNFLHSNKDNVVDFLMWKICLRIFRKKDWKDWSIGWRSTLMLPGQITRHVDTLNYSNSCGLSPHGHNDKDANYINLFSFLLGTGSFKSTVVCNIPWPGAPWLNIWSMEGNGMARKRSIYWFQVLLPCLECCLYFPFVISWHIYSFT